MQIVMWRKVLTIAEFCITSPVSPCPLIKLIYDVSVKWKINGEIELRNRIELGIRMVDGK